MFIGAFPSIQIYFTSIKAIFFLPQICSLIFFTILILNVLLPLLPSCWGFSFVLGCGYVFLVGSNVLLLMVVQQWAAILEFSQEKMSTCASTPLSSDVQETKIMASGPITSWQIDKETMETVTDFIFLGSKITADGDCSHEIKRCLLLGTKAMTNIDSLLKSRDIT